MARASRLLIHSLRQTAHRLAEGEAYQWGRMGMCNCGYLAQTVTGLTAAEIHAAAMESHGDWEEQANRYCPTSGLLIDHVLSAMMQLGLDRDDIRNLEKLADPAVVRHAGRWLRHNQRRDVVLYMRAWADLLESQLAREAAPVEAEPAAQPLH